MRIRDWMKPGRGFLGWCGRRRRDRLSPKIVGVDVCVVENLQEQSDADGAGTVHGDGDATAVRVVEDGVASFLTVELKPARFNQTDHFAGSEMGKLRTYVASETASTLSSVGMGSLCARRDWMWA